MIEGGDWVDCDSDWVFGSCSRGLLEFRRAFVYSGFINVTDPSLNVLLIAELW
jgi:hypothetical protein